MNTSPSVLALITARGGSKGLPRKNVLIAGGKPLIGWTIDAARDAKCVSRVVLSSDSDEIVSVAKSWGCDVPFKRPSRLATDEATSMDVVLHALDELPHYDYIVLLQPTSPQRTAQDIDNAFELMIKSGASSCVSVTRSNKPPEWLYFLNADKRMSPILGLKDTPSRRQDASEAFYLNGAIYFAATSWIKKNLGFLGPETVAYEMPANRSIDIDSQADFEAFCISKSSLGAS